MNVASQTQGVKIEAIVWPACQCGQPYWAHVVPGCAGYRPSRPVANLGTRAYRPSAGLSLWKRLACSLLWWAEYKLQGYRETLDLG